MKKVFLLGDSICLGYCGHVRELLGDEAEVFNPGDNGRFTGYTYVSLPGWSRLAGDPAEVDVVHWNNGHWDCAHWNRAEEPYQSPEDYGRWLKRVYGAIRRCFPNARVIFATTTGVDPTGYERMQNPRSNEQIAQYNRVAKDVMAQLGVPVNDLSARCADFPNEYFVDGVHYCEDGYKLLAEAVAAKIREFL